MNRILNSSLLSIFLIFLIFLLGNGLVNLNNQRNVIEQEVGANKEKIAEAEKNTEELSTFLKNFENPAFLEREARLKFNYKYQDEQVAFIYRDATLESTSKSFIEELKSMSNYKKWWYYLMGY